MTYKNIRTKIATMIINMIIMITIQTIVIIISIIVEIAIIVWKLLQCANDSNNRQGRTNAIKEFMAAGELKDIKAFDHFLPVVHGSARRMSHECIYLLIHICVCVPVLARERACVSICA